MLILKQSINLFLQAFSKIPKVNNQLNMKKQQVLPSLNSAKLYKIIRYNKTNRSQILKYSITFEHIIPTHMDKNKVTLSMINKD